ncbi:MAG: hypothetical protein J6A23_05545 [Thermoguttaceae bacterium]|nr:hypothetical protein [Thermoguttaceae bacterium]
MRSIIRFFILFAVFSNLTAGTAPLLLFGNESTETVGQNAGSRETIFLEFVWMQENRIREALLMVPPKKVPMLLVRFLDEEEKMTGLTAARGEFLAAPDEDQSSSGLTLQCSEPKVLFGLPETAEEVPDLLFIQGRRGAVDLNGRLAPCIIAPVLPDDEEKILGKYRVPEKGESR